MADQNVEAVKAKLDQRSRRGVMKYGCTTADAKLDRDEWLKHLQEELMDAVVYIEAMRAAPPAAEHHSLVVHFRSVLIDNNLCGASGPYGVVPENVTCPACLAKMQPTKEVVHLVGDNEHDHPVCGDEAATYWTCDRTAVTCSACLASMETPERHVVINTPGVVPVPAPPLLDPDAKMLAEIGMGGDTLDQEPTILNDWSLGRLEELANAGFSLSGKETLRVIATIRWRSDRERELLAAATRYLADPCNKHQQSLRAAVARYPKEPTT